ncbi:MULTISPECIES: ergothioneine biosynthesis protein EgtB [unclassified Paenibacillus]|uniref:ergothioneine biosynthesis protein EgtB n=1 Tax=unclassified Paenibacillus TaxID=185978 RepID=UPI001AE3D670|nr:MULTISPECIES: ergothioneine biosynthesis protein EgtB [unclassified Paenibacillus]MBP1154885.1 ergothioneine biosynthesis protein EgtB [Paenibacillus sp. PvP091]MBP1169731.1 ergothioneine biosynthesis protein EgtB [Paenibacillus sp. PvR098]MBP2440759.1 ergothioneine biosynthesis protein EgtB [Paenibacillus sp. PvP052]
MGKTSVDLKLKSADRLKAYFSEIRTFTEKIVEPLKTEDFIIQAVEDVSPAKWHLAHTTWFFEAFVLAPHDSSYQVFHPQYDYLFNSYYITHGTPFDRSSRGLLSRPTVHEVMKYRHYVDERLLQFLDQAEEALFLKVYPMIEVGLHHEQQHQELLFMDMKYNFSVNPFKPVYLQKQTIESKKAPELKWMDIDEELSFIGHEGEGFSFDNERPRHKIWLHPYRLASRPVTNGEFMAFIEDGGYDQPSCWLSEGWATMKERNWKHPLYWEKCHGVWHQYTLHGLDTIHPDEPVCHVSYYEADAYARWTGNRLPTEAEWEHAFQDQERNGNFAESEQYHPNTDYRVGSKGFSKGYGDVWEWTMSPYSPYPGNKPYDGTLGEYNAKFMCNQIVLRGGSCVTPETHIRPTYRNFFAPDKRWQFGGIRLAGDRL